MDNRMLTQEGNTLKYVGKIDDLPHCKKCVPEEGLEIPENHEFLTYEHPYKLEGGEKNG